jgi:hypothetical protein
VQSDFSEIREALASATQPLISDPAARPEWINLYSPHDVFGGALDYFDPANGRSGDGPAAAPPPPAIDNRLDPEAWMPLLAHNQYWTNGLLLDLLTAPVPAAGGAAVPPAEAGR